MELRVNINDKMSKITDIYSKDAISGYVVWNGVILDHLDDYTFAKKFVKHEDKFGIVCESGGSGGTILQWMRFPRIEYNSYIYNDFGQRCGICYIPK